MSVLKLPKKAAMNPRMAFFVIAGFVAIAYVVIGAALLRQDIRQGDLSSQLDSAQAVLTGADDVRREAEALPERLAAANQELAAAQEAFPTELDSNGILQTLLALAEENRVDVLSVDAVPPAEELPVEEPPADDSAPAPITFDLKVSGALGQLVQFVTALGEGATSTTTISNFALQEEDGQYMLDIQLTAHARSLTGEASSSEDESSIGEGTEAISGGEATPSE